MPDEQYVLWLATIALRRGLELIETIATRPRAHANGLL